MELGVEHVAAGFRYLPAIIVFLGFNPLPEPTTLADRLVRHRRTLGVSQKAAAGQIGVDPGTLARWEQGEREPASGHPDNVTRFLAGNNTQRVRRAG